MPVRDHTLKFNAAGHPEIHEFNTKGIEVVCLPLNTMLLIQPLDQGAIRTFKAHNTWYSMERMVNAMEGNPNRGNIVKVWEDYTIEDTIIVIGKSVKAIKSETKKFLVEKTVADVVYDFAGLENRASQGNHERGCGYGGGGKSGR